MKYVLLIVTSLLFIMVPITADSGSLEISSDIDSVPIYIDNTFAGVTPLTVTDIEPGYHLVKASPEGLFQQTRNISVNSGELSPISFIFLLSDYQIPAMVRIGDCVGTPESSDLDGTAFDLHRISDDTLMAYFSGRNEGIQCMASSDGISWDKMPDSCLEGITNEPEFRNDPWVFLLPDGSYRMIFSKTVGNVHSLYSATSPDGIRFTGEEKIIISGDEEGFISASPAVPSGIVYADGTVRIYYHISGVGIKSAISDDMGISWKSEEGVRIKNGTDPTLILLPDGRTGIVYVDTTPKSKGQRIFYSLSEDGLDFSRYRPVQILESIEPGVWLMDPEVITEDETFYLYFSVMGIEGMQNQGLPGILRSIINPDCLERSAVLV